MIKLSEAMRKGAKLRPQAFGVASSGIGTCALGAAYEALGGNMERPTMNNVEELIKEKCGMRDDLYKPINSPICEGALMLACVIIDLNDEYKWTREAIADWLESIGY